MTALPLTVPELTIDAVGTPAPKGSKKCVGGRGKVKHRLVEMSPLLDDWTAAVVAAAKARRNLTGWATLTEPACVEIWAWFARPKTVTREYPSTRGVGDIDKIARGCLDALTVAEVLADDSLIVDLYVHERYSGSGVVGARIVVSAIA